MKSAVNRILALGRVLAELLLQLNKISDQASMEEEPEVVDVFGGEEHDDSSSHVAASEVDSGGSTQVRVIVVAATNRPDDCDPALLRRFGIRVHVQLPGKTDRRRLLKKLLKDIEHTISKRELSDLALSLEGWSGSEIENLTREAAMAPVRECIRLAARKKRLARGQKGYPGSDADPHRQARDCLLEGFSVSG